MKEIDIEVIRAEIDEDDNLIKALKQEFKKLGFQLSYLEDDKQVRTGKITERDIELAKEVPISIFLETNRLHKVKCPFHNDKTASLHVYTKQNSWYCFGECGSGGSVIDLYMKLHSCTFVEAIKKLLHEIS